MRRARFPIAASIAMVAALAATGAPATAATQTALPTCGAGLFDGLAALGRAGTARGLAGGLRREKDTERFSGGTEIGQKTPGKPTAGTIGVYVHVITKSDGTGAVSAAAVDAQIAVLNSAFAGAAYPGGLGADTGFRFVLRGLETTASDSWFAQETFADEIAMKTALKRGGSSDLNVYTTSGGGFLGWAYYPSIVRWPQYAVLDGVVIHFGSLPGGYLSRYNLGHTATHEVGHYLGLAHTFEKGCIGWGDYVDDTAFISEPTFGCPVGKDTCTRGSGVDPIHNYMDYSDDACYWEFTQGQAERMQKQFAHWRLKRS